MLMKAFSVYDSKATSFMSPFFMINQGVAIRSFKEWSNDPQTMLCKYPTDYVLYEIGSFDDQTGEFVSLNPHNHLGLAADYKEVQPIRYTPGLDVIKKAVENPLATAEEITNGSR